MAAASQLRNEYCFGTELSLEAGCNPTSPFVDLGFAAPEAELAAGAWAELVGHQSHAIDSPTWSGCSRSIEPAIELPTHPVGNSSIGECSLMAPQTNQLLAMFGRGFDGDADTGDTVTTKPPVEVVGESAGDERNPVDPICRRINLSHN